MRKNQRYRAILLLRSMAFVIVAYAMVIRPAVQTFKLTQVDSEWINFDAEEGSGEEEQKEAGKGEIMNLKNVSAHEHHFAYFDVSLHYGEQRPTCGHDLEIPLPPPEQV